MLTRSPAIPPLWRHTAYLRLWGAQLVSTLGSRMSALAFPLVVLAMTHSPFQAGLVGFLRGIPYPILSLPAGALVDRRDRKRVMVICDVGRGLVFFALAATLLSGHASLWLIDAVALVEGTLYVFFNVAEVAALPSVVPAALLPAAAAQNEAIWPLTGLAGTPLGGVLLQGGRFLPFGADAVSYFMSALAIGSIPLRFAGEQPVQPHSLRQEIAEGLRWLWHEHLMRSLAFISAGNNFVGEGVGLVVIVLARNEGAAPATIGLIFALGAVGGLAGSIAVAPVRSRFRYGWAIVASRWLLLAIWLLLYATPNAVAVGLVLAGFNFGEMLYGILQYGRRITLIPDHLQGRANSAFRLFSFGTEPLGAAAAGALLSRGTGLTIAAFAVLLTLLALAATLDPNVRRA